jgi:purine-binding chemotaxis protein CheW
MATLPDPIAAATANAPDDAAAQRQQYATFMLGASRYAVPMQSLAEILPLPPIVPVPLSPDHLAGLANLRGQVIPVIRLRSVFAVPGDAHQARARLLVIRGKQPVGFIVDRVAAALHATAAEIEAAGAQATDRDLVQGALRLGEETALLVDFQQLLQARFATLAASRSTARPEARARHRQQAQAANATGQQLITFTAAGQLYGLPVAQVQEVLRRPTSTMPVPHARAHILGVTVHHERLLPIVSLRQMLSLPEPAQGDRLVVVALPAGAEAAGHFTVGLLVDAVSDILVAPDTEVETLPPLLRQQADMAEITAIYRSVQGRRLVSILSASTLFTQADARSVVAAAKPLMQEQQGVQEDIMEENMQVLVFRLGQDEFAVPVADVSEVVRVPATLTRLPKAPDFVHGVMNLRGKIVPIIDQRQRFGLPAGNDHRQQRILVVTVDQGLAGLIVDAVSEVRTVPQAALEEAPVLSGEQAKFISQLVNLEAEQRILLLLDLAQLLNRNELKALARLRASASTSVQSD